MRTTRQREAVREAVRRLGCHPSADAVYEEVRKSVSGISLGTVYRNLRLLSEAGEIAALDVAGSACRYDACVAEHYHFRCEKCGELIDVTVPIDPDLDHKVQQLTGLDVRCHVLEFRGLCDRCQDNVSRDSGRRDEGEVAFTGQSAT
jgi:Fur family peroxide stress response transcriptional regulator